MAFEFKRFCQERGVPLAPAGHKHSRPGWIQVECPFCTGNPGYHLGYEIQTSHFNCWRCGFHKEVDVIAKLLSVPIHEAVQIWKQYRGRPVLRERRPEVRPMRLRGPVPLPFGTARMTTCHRDYLIVRKFDPDLLERTWKLKGTGHLGPFKWRIIAPIIEDGVRVSFQGRDITGRSHLRYKTCPKKDERIFHKHTVYGLDLARNRNMIVITEGITDVWRLGPGAVATFGIQVSTRQILLLKEFPRRVILFDSDDEAREQAVRLSRFLSAYPGETVIVTLRKGLDDPGAMDQKDADCMMKEFSRCFV